MAYDHGINVTEQATSVIAPIVGTAGLQVIIGTAPVNMAADPYGCTNKPMLCYSFKEAVENVGYSDDFKNYTLCQSIDASFRVFNVAPIVLINVLDPAKHKKEIEATTCAVENGVAKLEETGVLLDTVVVKNATEVETLAADTDYILSFSNTGEVIVTLMGDHEEDTEIKVSATAIDPEAVEYTDIIGGLDANTGTETGMEVIRQVRPLLGLTPGLLLAPGWSQNANVAAVLQAKCEKINGVFSCECVVDVDCSESGATKYTDVKTVKEKTGISSNHAYPVWPKCMVGTKAYYMSALAAACTAYTDAENEDVPNMSPSNKSLKITATVLEDGTEIVLDQDQANTVNSYGVATAWNQNGYILWGNNTAGYPATTDPKDRWFPCRRFFSWWGNSFILTYFQKVDDPMNTRLIDSIVDSENIRGNSYAARGFCAAAVIKYNANENPATDILNGIIRFHLYLAPYTPAEKIEAILEFDVNALTAVLTGGAS
ncbi:MAG: phage tail sheath family protein [Anaerotignum sp.]|nr:phage tail sheath family protein [Anaerotignum sp.]